MKKKHKTIAAFIVLLLAAGAAYFIFKGTSEEEKVRKTLVKLTTLADKPQNVSPTEFAVKLRTMQTIFAEQVVIDFGARRLSDVYSARSLEPLMINFRKHFITASCSLSDEEITVNGERANAVFACRFKGRPQQGNYVDEVRDVSCQLVKHDKTWYIEKISINDILER